MPNQCSTCGSVLGFYEGSNGAPRCLNCFHDQDIPKAKESPPPEPNKWDDIKAKQKERNPNLEQDIAREKAVQGQG